MSHSKPLNKYDDNISNGVWFLLHTIAERAQTPELMRSYSVNFHNLCDKMNSCGCEDHCKTMLEQLRPEKYFHFIDNEGIPDGCLRHSVDCHNSVNKRLDKKQHSYESVKTALQTQKCDTSTSLCEKKCHWKSKKNNNKVENHKNPIKRHFHLVQIGE